jgi:hypothetical protein
MCDTEQIHTGGSSSGVRTWSGHSQYNIEKILWFAENEKKHLQRLGLWKDAKNAVFGKL